MVAGAFIWHAVRLCAFLLRVCAQNPKEAREHFGLLFIRFIQIFKKLATAYDQIVHPQKRRYVSPHLPSSGCGGGGAAACIVACCPSHSWRRRPLAIGRDTGLCRPPLTRTHKQRATGNSALPYIGVPRPPPNTHKSF